MHESDHCDAHSVAPPDEDTGVEPGMDLGTCSDPTQRTLILTALATGACLASRQSAAAEEDRPGSDERPHEGDVLVFSEGEHAGEVIKPQDLRRGGPPLHAWPKDAKT